MTAGESRMTAGAEPDIGHRSVWYLGEAILSDWGLGGVLDWREFVNPFTSKARPGVRIHPPVTSGDR